MRCTLILVPALTLAALAGCGGAEAPSEPTAPAPEAPEKAEAEAPAPAKEIVPTGTITVTTLKKGTVEDAHTMKVSTEALSWGTPGDLSTLSGALTIHTDTWDSPIDLRDERVQSMFFQAAAHPTATFDVDKVEGLGTLEAGASAEGTVTGTLHVLSGATAVTAPVKVHATDTGWSVELAEPVEVKASDLGLSEALQQVAGACGVELADATKVAATFTIPKG